MAYRDELEAALSRVAALEAELAAAGRGPGQRAGRDGAEDLVRRAEARAREADRRVAELGAALAAAEGRAMELEARLASSGLGAEAQVAAAKAEVATLEATVRAKEVRVAALEAELAELRPKAAGAPPPHAGVEAARLRATITALAEMEAAFARELAAAEVEAAELEALPEGEPRRREARRRAADVEALRSRLELVREERRASQAALSALSPGAERS